MKKAFTLVELILVIVIMGILALFGSNIYANVYKNYIFARSIDVLESKTQLALEQISSRLLQRIHVATIARISETNLDFTSIESSTSDYHILEWIGQSEISKKIINNDGSNGIGWSGFANLEDSNATNLNTPGSNLQGAAVNIVNNSEKTARNLALIFLGGQEYVDVNGFGFGDGTDTENLVLANLVLSNGTNMVIDANTTRYTGKITERYYLAHSAYALVPSKPTDYVYTKKGKETRFRDFNLTLYYDYRPWLGERFTEGKHDVIASNVTLFRFRGNYGSIDLKICMRDPSIPDADFVVCKSKVVQ